MEVREGVTTIRKRARNEGKGWSEKIQRGVEIGEERTQRRGRERLSQTRPRAQSIIRPFFFSKGEIPLLPLFTLLEFMKLTSLLNAEKGERETLSN